MATLTEKQGRARRWTAGQGTTAVPLIAPATVGFEAEQLEHLLHGDFRAQPVEVDAGHAVPLC